MTPDRCVRTGGPPVTKSTGTIRVDRTGGLVRITIDRPEVGNALTLAMCRALADAVAEADADPGVRVVVLTGAGEDFCAGSDLDDLAADQETALGLRSPLAEFHQAVLRSDTVLVAAVDGAVVGSAATALLHFDLVYATRRSHLKYPFVAQGLAPDGAGTLLLPQRLGPQRAAQLLLLGERVSAAQAARLGLVTEVVEDREHLHTRVAEQLTTLLAAPAAALRATRALLRTADRDAVLQMAAEGATSARLFASVARGGRA
ncbi:enoyl-CoA hydratase/isomerase family protein [Streptomyces sp. NPDC006476]|uniref:enoyl-CoA hydratase/isomerase family protein n=1 Tax=Streptomyces sp. NPDC006476 TaxID=3157175 RepID=UPI0033A822C1